MLFVDFLEENSEMIYLKKDDFKMIKKYIFDFITILIEI
jgi:hypothetical protein